VDQSSGPPADAELTLAVRALDRATEAGEWKLAEVLARRLERLELARSGAIDFATESMKRGRKP
jgi:hypothetical protein